MRKLLAKDVAFVWSSQCEKELQYLKTCLTSDPILQPINTEKDLIIMTDASGKTGLGYQILQIGDDCTDLLLLLEIEYLDSYWQIVNEFLFLFFNSILPIVRFKFLMYVNNSEIIQFINANN